MAGIASTYKFFIVKLCLFMNICSFLRFVHAYLSMDFEICFGMGSGKLIVNYLIRNGGGKKKSATIDWLIVWLFF